ncbi:MAG TPA: hypothetical protein VHK69_12740 [Chitinophagaceae bacterium]|jgi:hypothetical protein|nr:hypothetical protein [Chitinophagaceae bacterium]
MLRILLFFTVSALLLSCDICSRKVDCPAFTANRLTEWFPYSLTTPLTYASDAGVQHYTLRSVHLTGKHTKTGAFLGPEPTCEAYKYYVSEETTGNRQPRLAAELRIERETPETEWFEAEFRIGSTPVYLFGLTDTGFQSAFFHEHIARLQTLPEVTLGNRTFRQVQRATADTVSGTPALSEVYVARGEGIVAYREHPSRTLWVKQ